jgi:antigen flippase
MPRRAVTARERLAHGMRAPVARTSAALLLSQVLLGVAGIVAARILGPDGRGIVVGVTAWMGMLPVVFLLAMQRALAVRVASAPRELGSVAGSLIAYVVVVGLPVGIGAALLVPHLVADLGPAAAGIARWSLLVAIPASIANELLLAVTLARGRHGVYNACRVTQPVVLLAATLALAAGGRLTPTTMVAATVASVLACLVWLVGATPWRGTQFPRGAFVADLRFGARAAVAGWASMVNARLDFLLLSVFVSASQLGFYAVANNVMLVVTTIPSAAATLLMPRVASVAAGGASSEATQREQVALIYAHARRYGAVAAAGGACLALTAPFVVPLAFGRDFAPAVAMIWILIPGFVARAVTAVVVEGATGMRRVRVGNYAELAALVVTAALLAALLPPFAATGAAVASTAAYLTACAVALASLRRVARAGERDVAVPDVRPAPAVAEQP